MVAIKSGGDGTLSRAPSLLLSASPRAHHVAPCPIVSLWWSLICICTGTRPATGSPGAQVPLMARVPDVPSAASIHLPQPAPWENSELFLSDLWWDHASSPLSPLQLLSLLLSCQSWLCFWPSPPFLNAPVHVSPLRWCNLNLFHSFEEIVGWNISAVPWMGFVTFGVGSKGPLRRLRWSKMGQRQKHRGESGAEVWLSESTMHGSGPGVHAAKQIQTP